jgi:HEAT repeat protein
MERYTHDAIRLLATALCDKDAEVREDAARGLYRQARELHKGVRLLGGALIEKPSDAMAVVHEEFQKLGAIEPLRERLKDKIWNVRREAAVTLGLVGASEAVAELIELVKQDSDWHVREQSAGALGLIGDRQAVEPLAKALRSDKEFPVRLYCARALGDLGDPRSVPALSAALHDEHRDVQREARHALNSIGGPEAKQSLRGADTA